MNAQVFLVLDCFVFFTFSVICGLCFFYVDTQDKLLFIYPILYSSNFSFNHLKPVILICLNFDQYLSSLDTITEFQFPNAVSQVKN